MQRRLHTDWQLQFRMFFTMALLAVLYLVFAVILARSGVGFPLIVIIVGGLALAQYYYSDRLVLASTGARLVSESELPQVHDAVGRLAAMANLPKPRVALIRSPMPNAFATGRNPKTAVIAVTSGLLDRLQPGELEAVLGHEMTHIHNHDMTVMAMASFFATIAAVIVQNAFFLSLFGGLGGGGFGGGNRRRGDSVGLVIVVSLLVYFISFLLVSALSRYREYAADRGSALLTGRPADLASALMRISGSMARIPTRDLRTVQHANAMFIIPAAVGQGGMMELFMTHPSLEHRLNQLRRIERQLAEAGIGGHRA